MTAPAPTFADTRRLFVRLWRIRLGRLAIQVANVFAGLAERLLPPDLRLR